jgi:amino-acid N-acetyltransferase
MSDDKTIFVQWFRSAAPYIHAHRGKTFVVQIGGEVISSDGFQHLVHDIALLNSLGVRLVIVFGARPQIDALLNERGIESSYVRDLRVTDETALDCVKEAVGSLRIRIESMLSMGLPNSPMAGACVKVASGNFVTAQPAGIVDGIDLKYTGQIRRVDSASIDARLDAGDIVLLPSLGYSPTGETFNLSSIDTATQCAIELSADKLLFMSSKQVLTDDKGNVIRQITRAEAEKLMDGKDKLNDISRRYLATGILACQRGVKRIHFIDQNVDGVILQELFSRDGAGTLLSTISFDAIRPALIEDIGGILELVSPLEEKGVLVRRSREKMETEIGDYTVLTRDGAVIACAAMHIYEDEKVAELACLAVHRDYEKNAKGRELFNSVEMKAAEKGVTKLFVLTTHASHWFLERGFIEAGVEELPVAKQQLYNYQRNSKVLIKEISYL